MDRLNRRLGKNVYWSLLLFAIISFTLISGTAFCEEVEDAIKSVAEAGRACALGGDEAGADAALSQLYLQYPTQPQVVPAIESIAQTFFTKKNIAKAQAVYSDAITKIPADHQYAVWLHKRVILCQIAQGNITGASQSIGVFKNAYSNNPQFSIVLLGIADDYLTHKKYDKARDLWQYVAQNTSDTSLAIRAKSEIILYELKQGNDSAADQVITSLMNEHSADEGFCASLLSLAKGCDKLNKHDISKAFTQYVAQNTSDTSLAIRAKSQIILSELRQGNDSAADQVITSLMNEHSADEGFCASLLSLAKGCDKMKKHGRAKVFTQYVAQNSTDSSQVLTARTWTACMDIKSGNYDAADQAIAALLNDYSGSQELSNSILVLAKDYQAKKRDKAIELYRYFAVNSTDTNKAFKALETAVILGVYSGAQSVVDQAVEEFKQKFSEHPAFYGSMHKIGMKLYYTNKPGKSRDVHYYVFQNTGDERLSLKSLDAALQCELKLNNKETLDQALEMLDERWGDQKRYLDWVLVICGAYSKQKDPSAALPYLELALTLDSEQKTRTQLLRFKAACHAAMGDDEQVELALNDVLQIDASDLGRVLLKTAARYFKEGKYEKSITKYKEVLEGNPTASGRFHGHAGIARCSVRLGDHEAVTAAVEKLFTDHARVNDLGRMVFIIGEDYNRMARRSFIKDRQKAAGYYHKAISVWDKIILNNPDKEYVGLSYYFTGFAYREMRDDAKAIEYFELLLEKTPELRYAWDAQHQITRALNRMYMQKKMTLEEVKPLILESCEKFRDNYPDCRISGAWKKYHDKYSNL